MSRPRILPAIVLALIVSGAVEAHADVVRRQLENGLVVLAREKPAAAAVAISVFIRIGSRWEPETSAGITNLLQLVLVKGTTSRSALEIAEGGETMGGGISASGDIDYAEIRGTSLARHWKELLALIADVTLRPSLPPSEIDNERRVVASMLRNRLDQPFPLAFDTMMSHLFRNHPYGAPALGRAMVLDRLDRATLLEHYRRYYRAGRIVVSVSGQVRATDVVAEVARVFADAPRDDRPPDPPLGTPAVSLERVLLSRAAAQAQIMMGFLAPPIGHSDYAAVKVLQTSLGGGMSGRLFSELRDKQGLAYSTGALYPGRVELGFFLAFIGTAPANATRVEQGMREQIERVRSHPISGAELERARSYLLGQFVLDRRTNARLAWYEAFYETAGVGHDFADRYVRALAAVTADDVLRVAKAYLTSPTVVRLEPVPR